MRAGIRTVGLTVAALATAVSCGSGDRSDPGTTDAGVTTTDAAATGTGPTVATTTPHEASSSTTSVTTSTVTSSTVISTTIAIAIPPTTTIAGSRPALEVLATIPVAREQQDGYQRELFGYGSPVDDRGCRTRSLVLMRDSATPAQVSYPGCAVVAGDWYSAYDGMTWSDPGEVEVDHVVALKEAWDSGAHGWDASRLEAFANDVDDPRTLRVVTGSVNSAKGSNDPSNWLPPDPAAVCGFLADWVAIKARWELSMDESEHGRIRNVLTDRCPGQLVAPWSDVPPPAPATTVPPTTATSVVLVVPVVPAVPPAANCDASYPEVCIPPSPPDLDCGDITFRRFTVLPPDPHRFDGDSNGVGCER